MAVPMKSGGMKASKVIFYVILSGVTTGIGAFFGAIVGGIYLISIYLLSSIINQKFALSMQSIGMIISGIVCGMFGGILGVNKSR